MADLKVREFANKLVEAAGFELSAEAARSIRESETIENAQRAAVSWGIEKDVVEQAALDADTPFVAGDMSFIGNVGGTSKVLEGITPSNVDPNGANTAATNNDLTPGEIDAASNLAASTGDPTLDALLAGLDDDEADEPVDLLPPFEGVTREIVEAKIAQPGYQFYYGDPDEGYTAHNPLVKPTIYTSGDEVSRWTGYSPEVRAQYTQAMVDAGMIDKELVGGGERKLTPQEKRLNWEAEQRGEPPKYGDYEGTAGGINPSGISEIQINGFRDALGAAGYLGTTPMSAIRVMGKQNIYAEKNKPRGGGGGGGGRAPFVVPASLRTIPDYPTLQQNVKEMMRSAMGRNPEDWEMTMLADEMQAKYKEANAANIDAARAAYDQGNRGVGTEIEVPDPGQTTQKYLEDTWANEIDRQKDIGERANTNNLLMQSLTSGSRMVS